LKIPHGKDWAAFTPLLPIFLSYVLSFIYLGIYWNNHHHLFQATQRVNGKILWANLHLLFWLSLVPFATGWMGENYFAPLPTALYGGVLLCAALAYELLQYMIIKYHGSDHMLKSAVGKDRKGKISLACYLAAIPLAFVNQWIAGTLYIVVAAIWLIPDKRIESRIQ
jgi:TMEM175 potassium channel family protein